MMNPNMNNEPRAGAWRRVEVDLTAAAVGIAHDRGEATEAIEAVLAGILLGAGERVEYANISSAVSGIMLGALLQTGGKVTADVLLSFVVGMTKGIDMFTALPVASNRTNKC